MLVQVVGLGTVGRAQAFLARRLGHRVVCVDRRPVAVEWCDEFRAEPADADMTFVAVPEEAVEEVVAALARVKTLVVVRSTTPPGTTERLMARYRLHIVHNPEFLREAHWMEDVLSPRRIVIGACCGAHGRAVAEFYRPLGAPIFVTTPTASEWVKVATNALRAAAIHLYNQVYRAMVRGGVPEDEARRAVAEMLDPCGVLCAWEGGPWGTKPHLLGRPFGGKCLPKDLAHFAKALEAAGVDGTLARLVLSQNEALTAPKDGM